MKEVHVLTPNKAYDIVFEQDYKRLSELIKAMDKGYSKIAILTDDKVGPLYADQMLEALRSLEIECLSYSFPNGEINKNYESINSFYDFLIRNRYDRNSLLIALGGGVVGDMVGFTSATYMRGVDFIQAPTSLLAQVDSSVGGKTGIDFNGYKNIVGAFYQPELVYINTSTLSTLDPIQFASGMGEALKHGMIMDSSYLEEMINDAQAILNLEHDAISRLVGRSCQIKANVVSQDEKEQGLRAILNFGHTIGHAVERLKNFELGHGQCVALGMVASSHISLKLGQLTPMELEIIEKAIKRYSLPTTVDGLSVDEIYQELFYDKKTRHNKINIVILDGIGQCYQNRSLTEDQIKEGIKVILN